MQQEKVKRDFWKYKVNDDQIKRIKLKDGEAIRRFWEDNEDLIRTIIVKEVSKHDCRFFDIWDFVSQVYVDLPYYDWNCSYDITYGIYRSVRYCLRGYKERSNCALFSNEILDGITIEDTIVGAQDIEDCYSVENENLYYKIALMLFPKSAVKQSSFLRRI